MSNSRQRNSNLNSKNQNKINNSKMVRTLVLTTLLIEYLEDLEEFNYFRFTLKKFAKLFKKNLLNYVDKTYEALPEKNKPSATQFITSATECLENSFNEIDSLYK